MTPVVIEKDAVFTGLLCSAALGANLLTLQMMQGAARFPAGERPPEDEALAFAKDSNNEVTKQSMGLVTGDEMMTQAKAKAMRATRNHQNALENVPYGLIIGWATILASGNWTQRAFFITFAIARWLHTLCYVFSLQPWRALAWALGWISIAGMIVVGLVESS